MSLSDQHPNESIEHAGVESQKKASDDRLLASKPVPSWALWLTMEVGNREPEYGWLEVGRNRTPYSFRLLVVLRSEIRMSAGRCESR